MAIMKYTVTEFPIWQINLKLNCFTFVVCLCLPFFFICSPVSLWFSFLIIVMMFTRRDLFARFVGIDFQSNLNSCQLFPMINDKTLELFSFWLDRCSHCFQSVIRGNGIVLFCRRSHQYLWHLLQSHDANGNSYP